MNPAPAAGELADVIQRAATRLSMLGFRLAAAESCTGGLVAAHCTSLAGSSEWFEASFVTYTAAAKTTLLGVPADLIQRCGVVSEPVACAMVEGVLQRCAADIAVSVTGIAGPGGGEPLLPVGTVWFGWKRRDEVMITTACHRLTGDRNGIREAACVLAMEGVLSLLDESELE